MKITKTSPNDYTITEADTEQQVINACKSLITKLGWEEGQIIDGKLVDLVSFRHSITVDDNENYSYMAFVCRRTENPLNKITIAEHPEHGAIAI